MLSAAIVTFATKVETRKLFKKVTILQWYVGGIVFRPGSLVHIAWHWSQANMDMSCPDFIPIPMPVWQPRIERSLYVDKLIEQPCSQTWFHHEQSQPFAALVSYLAPLYDTKYEISAVNGWLCMLYWQPWQVHKYIISVWLWQNGTIHNYQIMLMRSHQWIIQQEHVAVT